MGSLENTKSSRIPTDLPSLIGFLEQECFQNAPWDHSQILFHTVIYPYLLFLQKEKHIYVASYGNHPSFSFPHSDSVLGYCLYWENDWEVEILRWGIRPQYQGFGYGKLFFQFLCDFFRDKDVFLEVDIQNHRAIRIYEKCGFYALDRRKSYYENGNDAIVYYRKKQQFLEEEMELISLGIQ